MSDVVIDVVCFDVLIVENEGVHYVDYDDDAKVAHWCW